MKKSFQCYRVFLCDKVTAQKVELTSLFELLSYYIVYLVLRGKSLGNSLLIHIDKPENGSYRIQTRVLIKGWYLLKSEKDICQVPKLKVVLEQKSEEIGLLRKDMVLAGEVLNSSSNILQNLKIDLDACYSVNDIAAQIFGTAIPFSALIDLSDLFDWHSEKVQRFLLAVVAEDDGNFTISNTVEFSFPLSSFWGSVKAGFLGYPSGLVYSDYLIVDGWGLSKDEGLSCVQILLNDKYIGDATTKIASPEQQSVYSDMRGAECCRFVKVIKRTDIFNESIQHCVVSLTANLEFPSGLKHKIIAPSIVWSSSLKSNSAICGEIEQFGITSSGMLKIQGWVFNPHLDGEQLWFSSLRCCLELKDSGEDATLFWQRRLDIESRYCGLSNAKPTGFTIEVLPEAFGKYAGAVNLYVKDISTSQSICLTSQLIAKQIAELVMSHNAHNSRSVKIGQCVAAVVAKYLPSKKSFKTYLLKGSSGSSRRLLFASHNLSKVEGAPKILYDVIRHISKTSQCKILLVSPYEGELRKDYEDIGASVQVMPELSLQYMTWESYYTAFLKFACLAQSFAPHIIYANVIDSFYAIDYAYRVNLPSIFAIQESVSPLFSFLQLDGRIRLQFLHSLGRVSAFAFAAAQTRDLYAPFISNNSEVKIIPNGVDVQRINLELANADKQKLRAELGITEQDKVVSIIGTTTKRKGQDVFIREMSLLKTLMPNSSFKFFIVGARENEFLQQLKQDVARLGLSEDVQFVVEQANIGRFYMVSDVCVLCSREESAPLVSLEAFAYQVPLVSTTVFGLIDQIEDGVNAIAFDIGKEGELASKVKHLLEYEALRNVLIKGGLETLNEKFCLEKIFADYQELVFQYAGFKQSE